MGCKLERIRDWEARASAAGFCVSSLASAVGVSRRQLNRYFHRHFGRSAHDWMDTHRMDRALELLKLGTQVKRVALELGYTQPSNFSQAFRRVHGFYPSRPPPPSSPG